MVFRHSVYAVPFQCDSGFFTGACGQHRFPGVLVYGVDSSSVHSRQNGAAVVFCQGSDRVCLYGCPQIYR